MILDFIGRFHPLFVHLPIGIIFIAVLLKWWFSIKPIEQSESILSFVFKIAFYSAVFTCITGYLLADNGEYDEAQVDQHMWFGIALTMGTGIMAFWYFNNKITILLMATISILLAITGHLGGSITHGEDFLSFQNNTKTRKVITDINNALVYEDIIVPILEEKCYACHSSKKQKGKLRMDDFEKLMKGGENGKCISPEESEKSLLYQRLMLSESDEEHMPPKGKPQPTANEIKLITWWINEGAKTNKKVSEIENKTAVLSILKNYGSKPTESIPLLPSSEVSALSADIIEAIKKEGFVLLPVSSGSNYLSVNILNQKKQDIWQTLAKAGDNVLWLKANNTNLKDADLKHISELRSLTQLHIGNCNITDAGLKDLTKLENLQTLNLNNTKISSAGIALLANLKHLKTVYVFNTQVNASDLSMLKNKLTKTKIDIGGYKVATLESDTTRVSYEGK